MAETVVSLSVTGAWPILAAATTDPVPPPHRSWRHLVASYLALAAAPTANAAELVTVVAVIYAVCLFTAAIRRARTRRGR